MPQMPHNNQVTSISRYNERHSTDGLLTPNHSRHPTIRTGAAFKVLILIKLPKDWPQAPGNYETGGSPKTL